MSENRFRGVYDAHAADLLAYFVRRVDPVEDAADLVSEVFLVWWRRRPELSGDEERMWLYGVARKTLATYERGVRRRYRLAAALATALRNQPPVMIEEAAAHVTDAVSRLPARDRDALLLSCWEGLTPEQIGAVLGIRPGAARVRLHRARQRLRQLLEEDENAVMPRHQIKGAIRAGTTGSERC